jgi:hypothetical protein
MAWLWFEDIERKGDGLLKTKRTDIPFRLLVACLNLFATPFLLLFHYLVIYPLPCIRDTLTSCCCRFLFTESGVGSFFQSFLFYDREFPPDASSLGDIKAKNNIVWMRAQDLTYSDKNNQTIKLNKLVDAGM